VIVETSGVIFAPFKQAEQRPGTSAVEQGLAAPKKIEE
jgi:hypothetical protein